MMNKRFEDTHFRFSKFWYNKIAPNIPIYHYILRLKAENKKLRKLAYTDNLTQVFNRNALNERLEQVIQKVNNTKTPLQNPTVEIAIMVDMDKFKPINDNFGHIVGDAALKLAADTLTQITREHDTIGLIANKKTVNDNYPNVEISELSVSRYGGDEFVILATVNGDDGAKSLIERLEKKFNSLQLNHNDRDIDINASFGYAIITVQDTPETILQKADTQMYAKKQGRRSSPH